MHNRKIGQNKVHILVLFTFLFLLLFVVAKSITANYSGGQFSPDSWNFYALSKTIFVDFYNTSNIGHYQQSLNNGYHSGYAPLLPVMIASVNLIFDFGIYAGVIINIFSLFIILFLLMKISEVLYNNRFFGFYLFCFLLLNKYFIFEVVAAMSIPLAIVFQLGMFYVFIRKDELEAVDFILLGILSGLIFLTRVDFLAASFIAGFLLLLFFNKKASLFYFLSFFVVISPWIYFSYTKFGVLFVSNNKRTALLAISNYVADYFPSNMELPTLFNNPFDWIVIKIVYTFRVFYSMLLTILGQGASLFLILVFFALLFSKKFRFEPSIKSSKIVYGGGVPYFSDIWSHLSFRL